MAQEDKDKPAVGRVIDPKQEGVNDPPNILIYGSAGVGKSALVIDGVKDPRCNRMLILDYEGGISRVATSTYRILELKELGDPPTEGVPDIVRISTWREMQQVYNFLFAASTKNSRPYNVVVLDSLSEINAMAVTHFSSTSSIPKTDPDIPEIRDYQKTNNAMNTMLRAFRDLPGVMTILTALISDKLDKQGAVTGMTPDLVGKLAGQACAIYDYVGYMRMSTAGKRTITFNPSAVAYAKGRFRTREKVADIENPSLSAILDLIDRYR